MKTFFSFYGGIIAAAWYWWIRSVPGNVWLKYALLVAAGLGLGSYLYEFITVCVIPAAAQCTPIFG